MHRNPPNRQVSKLLQLAADQHGAFSSAQAVALGVSYRQLASLDARGIVRRRRRGLYVVAGSPDTHERRAMEAILAGPNGCVASHDTAAYLLGLIPAPTQVHVTVRPDERLRLDGVVAHRSPLPRSHVAAVGRIPVTTLARTVVDLASSSDLESFTEVLDPLLVNKRLRPERLLRVIDDIVEAPGRHGTTLLRTALDVWTAPIKPGSAAEVRLLRKLTEFGFGGFVTQHEVSAGDETFRLDVAWPEDRLLLEYSGKAFHGPRRWQRDENRAALITALGWNHREVDVADLVPGETALWNWLRRAFRRAA